MNLGLSSKKTSSRVIIAHEIWREDLKKIHVHLRYNYLWTTGKDRVKLLSSSMTQ